MVSSRIFNHSGFWSLSQKIFFGFTDGADLPGSISGPGSGWAWKDSSGKAALASKLSCPPTKFLLFCSLMGHQVHKYILFIIQRSDQLFYLRPLAP